MRRGQIIARDGGRYPRRSGQQPDKGLLTMQYDLCPAGLQQRCIADELEGVAKPLLGKQQQAAAFQVFAFPEGCAIRQGRDIRTLPADPVIIEPLPEIAGEQVGDATIEQGSGALRIDRQGPVVGFKGRVYGVEIDLGDAKVGPGLRILRLPGKGVVMAGDGLVQAPADAGLIASARRKQVAAADRRSAFI